MTRPLAWRARGTATHSHPSQLPLLPDLVEVIPLPLFERPAEAPVSSLLATSATLGLALMALLDGPAPLAKLQGLANTSNSSDLLDLLHALGLAVPCYTITTPGDTDGVSAEMVCDATKADKRRIQHLLKDMEGRND